MEPESGIPKVKALIKLLLIILITNKVITKNLLLIIKFSSAAI